MLKKQNFIVFSDDWGRHPFSCQHIMQHMLTDNRVLWVHTVGMRRPRLSVSDLKRSVQKLRSFFAPLTRQNLPENLLILSPPMLPFSNLVVRALNRRSVVENVRNRMRELGITAPVILTTLPNASEYLGCFGESLVAYYCVDDFTLWPGVNQQLVREMEQRLLGQADILFCSSCELASIKNSAGLRTEILPHGVDYDHFSSCLLEKQGSVSALRGLSKPVIGYFGLLGEWVDTAILEDIALSHPDWSLLLMGQVVADISRLAKFSNVHFTGPVPYAELPDYVANVDALILPYYTEGRGQTITPLKLREYIATGKPVISTAIPECVQYSPHIAIANPDEFVSALERALREPPDTGTIRQQIVAGESWLHRAEFLSSCLVEALEQKNRNRSAA